MPFLVALLPMLFGGQAPGSNFSNQGYMPNATATSLDRLAQSSRFG
jgi:hypothetical protein